MTSPKEPDQQEKSPTEAAGYIAGGLTAIAQAVMPIRMWITLISSAALIVFVLNSESVLNIARALCIYATLTAVLVGSAVYHRRKH